MLGLGQAWQTLARLRRCGRHSRTVPLLPASGNDRSTASLALYPRVALVN